MIVESYEDVIVLSGALKSNNWDTIQTAIGLTLRRHPSGVIIDCSGLTEMNDQGVLTFTDAMEYVRRHKDARIVLAAVPAAIMEILRETPEVRSQLPIVQTVDDARRSLDVLDAVSGSGGKKAKVHKEVQVRVLCVLQGNDHDMDVLVITRELINNIQAKVQILLPIVVPRDLPLTAPMVEVEERAVKSASRAKEIFYECRTPHEVRLERTRDLPGLLHEFSEELKASYTVLAVPNENLGEEKCMKIMRGVLAQVSRPVLFVRGHDEKLQ